MNVDFDRSLRSQFPTIISESSEEMIESKICRLHYINSNNFTYDCLTSRTIRDLLVDRRSIFNSFDGIGGLSPVARSRLHWWKDEPNRRKGGLSPVDFPHYYNSPPCDFMNMQVNIFKRFEGFKHSALTSEV